MRFRERVQTRRERKHEKSRILDPMLRSCHTTPGSFGICLRHCLRLGAVAILFAASAASAVAGPPEFYARREYGNNKGCESGPFAVGDINDDGIPDIVCAGGQFLFGKGDGTFYLSPDYPTLSGRDVTLLDLNGDGVLDMISLNNLKNWGFKIAFGNGNGTFGVPTFYEIPDIESSHLVVGDFNGDGIPDSVTVADQGVWLMAGKGDGVFNNPSLMVPGVGDPFTVFAAADMNGDGRLDLVVAASSGVAVIFGNGDGTFQTPVNYTGTYSGCNITVADINSDGFPDVICASTSNDAAITIFLGEAGGKLRKPYSFPLTNYEYVVVGDVNGDGIPDLVSDSVYVAYGLGKGRFSNPVYFSTASNAIYGTGITLGHLRNNKELDIVAGDTFDRATVLLNKGNGTFVEGLTSSIPSGFACSVQADFNGDGIPDLAYQNGSTFSILYGTGKLSAPFEPGLTTALAESGCPSNAADINGDGILDVMLSIPNGHGLITEFLPLLGVGNGTFVPGAPITVSSDGTVYLVDVNGDGKVDYIDLVTNTVAYGNGNGTFQTPVQFVNYSGSALTDVAWADLNGDGKLDFVVQEEDGIATYLLLSNGSGGFTQGGFGDSYTDTLYVAIGDLNGDGIPDLLLGSALNTMALYINDGKGNFTFNQTLPMPGLLEAFAPTILDLNGDGLPDIAVADGGDIGVLVNEGNLKFSEPLYFGQIQGTNALYYGNWHGQAAGAGRPDIVMPSSGGSLVMLPNETK